MIIHRIVVVGASAGGVEALSALLWNMPSGLPIAFFVVLHRSPHSPSWLPSILERTARLPAAHPRDGEKIRRGRIYVAPPDFHLLVGDGIIQLSRDPKEHHVRPAIDPLFRSGAQAYGRRVIGVLLSGMLDDGVKGLQEIKRNGGVAIVQAPAEAGYPDMPQNALAKIEIDHCAPVAQIRELMTRSADQPMIPMVKSSSVAPRTTGLAMAPRPGNTFAGQLQ